MDRETTVWIVVDQINPKTKEAEHVSEIELGTFDSEEDAMQFAFDIANDYGLGESPYDEDEDDSFDVYYGSDHYDDGPGAPRA